MPDDKLRCIAHFGTFDIDNYGDLLFPQILEHEVASVTERVLHVSPSPNEPTYSGSLPSIPMSALAEVLADIGAVVLGGGHLVAATPTSLEPYQSLGMPTSRVYPTLWTIPSVIAGIRGVPLCWNAPGVRRRLTCADGSTLRSAAQQVDYLAVRDQASRRLLRDAGCIREISVVPDTALGLPSVLPIHMLRRWYVELFQRMMRAVPDRTVVFHFKERYVHEKVSELAAIADAICRHYSATGILLSLGKCHGDERLQGLVGARMETCPVRVSGDQGLLTHVASIALSDLYVGSSLHGLITAIAYGRRGIVVADEKKAGFSKFSGFLEQVGGMHLMVSPWAQAARRVLSERDPPVPSPSRLADAREAVAAHWIRLRTELRKPKRFTLRTANAARLLASRVFSPRYLSPFT